MDNEIRVLWQKYQADKDNKIRETLILHYTWLVKYVVGRLNIKLPPSLEESDLINYGVLGLLEAIDRFDLSQGVKFETYAVPRVRGQIIDSLRSFDFLPRSSHRRIKAIEVAMSELSQSLGRTPTDSEMAAKLDLSIDDYHDWLQDANFTILSLDHVVSNSDGEKYTFYDALEDTNTQTPSELVDQKELKMLLAAAVDNLSERDQVLISLYYIEELTMKEIGQVLGVSESRVSQMHAKITLVLRNAIKNKIEPGNTTPLYNKRGKYAASVYAHSG